MATASSTSGKKNHIMMSYAWTGTQDLAYEVAEQLKNEGIPVWMDIRNGLGGNINDGMAEAVENSAAVCFFMTQEYQDSKNCKKELQYADKLEIPLIPCRCSASFKPSGWLGLISAGLMSYDFRDLSDVPVNTTMNKIINYIQTNILQIAPTVFPDLEGRTQPVIFRNRHHYRTSDETRSEPSPSPDYDNEQSPVHRSQTASLNEDRFDTQPCIVAATRELSSLSVSSNSEPNAHRFTSLLNIDDPKQMLMPLEGYATEPLVSLEEAVEPLKHIFCEDIRRYVYIAKKNTHKPADNLTCDESASIHLYSMQWSAVEDSLYIHLNRALRSVNRQTLLPWFRYLKLFLTALFKLPAHIGVVWRGVRADLSKQYEENEYVTWWGFSSCSASVKVVKDFLGDSGHRTLFAIETTDARNIRDHSYFSQEEEIVLFPGTYLRVTSKLVTAEGLTIIHLKVDTPPFPFLANPFNIVTHQEDVSHCASRPSAPKKKPPIIKSKAPHKHSVAQQQSNQINNKLKTLPKKK